MEDVGNRFVKILLMKSYFQDVEFDENGDIIRLKMHDLMHDLALLVASDYYYSDIEHKKGKRPITLNWNMRPSI
jgi:hypothetical protein